MPVQLHIAATELNRTIHRKSATRAYIFMAALRSRFGDYILQLWFLPFFTHRRSIAERGGCFQRRLLVCQFVCLSER